MDSIVWGDWLQQMERDAWNRKIRQLQRELAQERSQLVTPALVTQVSSTSARLQPKRTSFSSPSASQSS